MGGTINLRAMTTLWLVMSVYCPTHLPVLGTINSTPFWQSPSEDPFPTMRNTVDLSSTAWVGVAKRDRDASGIQEIHKKEILFEVEKTKDHLTPVPPTFNGRLSIAMV